MKKLESLKLNLVLAIFLLIILVAAAYLEFTFRKIYDVSGVIRGCFYLDAYYNCSYIESSKGSFLLTDGSLEKMRAGQDVKVFYNRPIKLYGRISRQRLEVRDLGLMNRFQVERWVFE